MKWESKPKKLDEKGRCCGIKPLVYKGSNPHLFCHRCDRAYNNDGEQIPNWRYKKDENGNWYEERTM